VKKTKKTPPPPPTKKKGGGGGVTGEAIRILNLDTLNGGEWSYSGPQSLQRLGKGPTYASREFKSRVYTLYVVGQ